MATYCYYCDKCEKQTEVVKSIKEFDREEVCSACKIPLKRLPPTQTSFQLKGTGWHATDYPKYK